MLKKGISCDYMACNIMASLESFATGAIALFLFIICLPRCVMRRASRWTRLRETDSTSDAHHVTSVHTRSEQELSQSSYKAEEHIQVFVVNDSYLPSSTTTVLFQEPSTAVPHHFGPDAAGAGGTPATKANNQHQEHSVTTWTDVMLPVSTNPSSNPAAACTEEFHIQAAGGVSVVASPFLASEGGGDVACGPLSRSESVAPGGGSSLTIQRTRSAPSSPLGAQERLSPTTSDGEATDDQGGGGDVATESLTWGVATDIGLRRSMEDTYLAAWELGGKGSCLERVRAVVGVFDGHNGAGAAEFAAENFVGFMEQGEEEAVCMEDVMDRAFRRCESELMRRMEDGIAGTTALVAAVVANYLHVANLGDCRAVLCCDGRATQVTRDHKPSNEKDRIIAAGGFLDGEEYLNGEIGVSRAIGDFHLQAEGIKKLDGSGPLIAVPELHSQELTPECEFLVLASDGIWDVISNQRAMDIVRKLLVDGAQPKKAAEELVEEAKLQGSRDNITAVILVLRSLPLPPRKAPVRKFRPSRLKLASRSMLDINSALQQAQAETVECPLGI